MLMGSPRSRARPCPRRGGGSYDGDGGNRARQGARRNNVGNGPFVDLLKDTRQDSGTLKDAFVHVAEVTGCSVGAVKRAYHRSRVGLGDQHARAKLTPSQETTQVSVAPAFSVNNVALSVAQVREKIKRIWGVQVSRT